MRIKRNFFTTDELVYLYQHINSLADAKRVAKELNRTLSTVKNAKNYLWEYVEGGKKVTLGTKDTYKRAIEHLKNGEHPTEIVQEHTAENASQNEGQSALEHLADVFDQLQKAIVATVIEEADKRTQNTLAQKERELAEQKEKYEQELIKLQTIIATAKDTSIIGAIQKSWGR